MALKIFGTDPANLPKPPGPSSNDVVGRFRSGHLVDGKPAALDHWRVTTPSDDVAAAIVDLLGGALGVDDTEGASDLEVYTEAATVDIIIDSPADFRERMVYFRNGKLIYASDGAHILDEHGKPTDRPDPHAELGYYERKALGEANNGPEPDVDLYFRLAGAPDLGVFLFSSSSWSLSRELARHDIADRVAAITGPTTGALKLEPVSFVARNGDDKGKTINYTATRITLNDKDNA